MEDYVIIGTVLQAMHMSKFKKKPKHLKKYELSTCQTYRPNENKSISYEIPEKYNYAERLSNKPVKATNLKDFHVNSS